MITDSRFKNEQNESDGENIEMKNDEEDKKKKKKIHSFEGRRKCRVNLNSTRALQSLNENQIISLVFFSVVWLFFCLSVSIYLRFAKQFECHTIFIW